MEAVLTKQSRVARTCSREAGVGRGRDRHRGDRSAPRADHRHGRRWALLGQLIPVSPSERKILLAAGGRGLWPRPSAPLASVVLAVELLIFEFSVRRSSR
jgi:hypothetical protein